MLICKISWFVCVCFSMIHCLGIPQYTLSSGHPNILSCSTKSKETQSWVAHKVSTFLLKTVRRFVIQFQSAAEFYSKIVYKRKYKLNNRGRAMCIIHFKRQRKCYKNMRILVLCVLLCKTL